MALPGLSPWHRRTLQPRMFDHLRLRFRAHALVWDHIRSGADTEDEIWEPETLEGARGLFNWGPQPPPSFLAPEDLAGLMTGAHSR